MRVSENNRGEKINAGRPSENSEEMAEFTDRGLSFFDEDSLVDDDSEESDLDYMVSTSFLHT